MSFLRKINRTKNNFLREIKKSALISFLKTQRFERTFDPLAVRKVLLLRLDDKIGDMVVSTGTAHLLAERGYHVSVLTGPLCCEMLRNCPYLDKVILYKKRMSLNELRAEKFDVVIDVDDVHDFERLKLAWRLKARHHVGFNKNGLNIYNIPIEYLNEEQHITERHKKILRLFNVDADIIPYRLGTSHDERNRIEHNLDYSNSDIIIAINPFSGAEDKDFSAGQIIELIAFIHSLNPAIKVVMIGQTKKVQSFADQGAYVMQNSTINTAIETVRISDVVVSTDTSIVHIANAINRQLVSIYNKRKLKDTGLSGYKIWAPNYERATQIVIEDAQVSDYVISNAFPFIKAAVEALERDLSGENHERH
ncbi:ADP-heptose:LPS heptosyltransferase [Erwinia toletana]|uniref:ADP-heptose:LPS heptosyltransferase n=1 Tax=Winslowiella toletana TaxID=92490 RepID=A0ABS4P936_9GAMM|nr:glycosyltransferase family 9 protein [Winslowiella toletana]MBP2169137.1 ADP-heptose:LPS heptosyltransferase [Winslowiella toletana]